MMQITRIHGFDGARPDGKRFAWPELDENIEVLGSGAVLLIGKEVEEDLEIHSHGEVIVIDAVPEVSARTPELTMLSGVFADEEICV